MPFVLSDPLQTTADCAIYSQASKFDLEFIGIYDCRTWRIEGIRLILITLQIRVFSWPQSSVAAPKALTPWDVIKFAYF